ncbi:MAG: 30S ribosomal protein S11 [Alphaproteobacteria bacterium]|nr:30S ribosomal protein S11 [Alphaproteobacteria bacterium]
MAKVVGKKKSKKNLIDGVAHVSASFNNTMVSITDLQGNVVCWASAGTEGFKGARKSTPFAAQNAGSSAVRKARVMGLKSLAIKVSGPGAGRESALRAIIHSGVSIRSVEDVTPIPHNGCRPPKKRRG